MIESMQLLVKSVVKYELLQYGIEMVDPVEKEDVIFSNRLHKDLYRIDQVIDYFCEFSKLNSSWKLVIGAEGEKTEMLKYKVNTLNISDKVEFVGWLLPADNKSWYAKSKIYISIPESDGTSVSVLEAMSAGCIPILSDIGVSYELIENGENGIIEKKNENPLDRAILLNREEVYLRNRALVELKASRNRCTDRFIEIYSNAIKNEN
jgi:glycosyltransferase involved in cell wall biosynthesis